MCVGSLTFVESLNFWENVHVRCALSFVHSFGLYITRTHARTPLQPLFSSRRAVPIRWVYPKLPKLDVLISFAVITTIIIFAIVALHKLIFVHKLMPSLCCLCIMCNSSSSKFFFYYLLIYSRSIYFLFNYFVFTVFSLFLLHFHYTNTIVFYLEIPYLQK